MIKRGILYILLIVSAIGFVLSLAAHIAAWMGHSPGANTYVLMIGAGIVFGIAVLPVVAMVIRAHKTGRSNGFFVQPNWAKYPFYVVWIYALVVVVYGIAADHLLTGLTINGQTSAVAVRYTSVQWMAGYAFAFALLSSLLHREKLRNHLHCENGHNIWPPANFCEECGAPVILSWSDSKPPTEAKNA